MEIREIELVDPFDYCYECEREEPPRLFVIYMNGYARMSLCEDCLRKFKDLIEEAL